MICSSKATKLLVATVCCVAIYAGMRDFAASEEKQLEPCWLTSLGRSSEVRLFETQLREGVGGGGTYERSTTHSGCAVTLASLADSLHAAVLVGAPSIHSALENSLYAPVGSVHINRSERGQSVKGFGGAFTEAAALTWSRLPSDEKENIVEAYWGDNGLRYSLGRVHMNSCDFCAESYSFAAVEDDYMLEYFDGNVSHDQKVMIPLMLAAKAAAVKLCPGRVHRITENTQS